MSQVNELIQRLKQKLRAADVTYADLAGKLGVSESTLKRWFSQGSFNIEYLDDICRVLDLELAEILPERRRRVSMHFLTEEQELELAADDVLLAVLYLVLAGHTAPEIVARYDTSLIKLRTYLIRLDQLGLIELHQDDRIIPIVTQSVRWLPAGPLSDKFARQMRQDFVDSDFQGKNERHWLVSGAMSPASLAIFGRKLELLLNELRDLIDLDSNLSRNELVNITFFAGHRPWSLPVLKGRKRL